MNCSAAAATSKACWLMRCERRLFVTVNHLYSSLTGPRTEDDFAIFARDFHGVETINGQMLACANRLAADFARRFGKPVVGGSDSHTLAGVARTFTEVPGAAMRRNSWRGCGAARASRIGESGDYWKLTGAVFDIGGSLIARSPGWRWRRAVRARADRDAGELFPRNCVRLVLGQRNRDRRIRSALRPRLRYDGGLCTLARAKIDLVFRAGLRPDAPHEPLARAALVPLVDAAGHARGRWLAVGADRHCGAAFRRRAALSRDRSGGMRGGGGIVMFHKVKRVFAVCGRAISSRIAGRIS